MPKSSTLSARTSTMIHADIVEITQIDPFDLTLSVTVALNRDSAHALIAILQRFCGSRQKKAPEPGSPGPVEWRKRPSGRNLNGIRK